jgi:hypothetical protein
VFDAALKLVVADPVAWTTHVPEPVDANVEPVTNVQGPLTTLYVSAPLSEFVVVAFTVKSAPG